MDKKKKKWLYWGGRVLFLIYLTGLCYFLFFAENYGRTPKTGDYSYNLVPFREIRRFWNYRNILGRHAVILNLFGNIAGFMPVGLLAPHLGKHRGGLWFVLFASFDISLVMELFQLIFKVGCFDVDDLLLNTLGGLIGYLLLKCIERFYGRKHNENKKIH